MCAALYKTTMSCGTNPWIRGGVGTGCSSFVYVLLLLLLQMLIKGIQSETVAPTSTPAVDNSTSSSSTQTSEVTTSFNLLIYFPQSAISLFSLGCFIGISMLVAMLTEKCYERLSLRDDSSDMSEHTKEILKARILGMVFGKKLELGKMTEKQRAMELAKKYGHRWQYRATMRKRKRVHDQKLEEQKKKQEALKKRRSSLFGLLSFGKSSDDTPSSSPEKAKPKSPNDLKSLSKKPSILTIPEGPSTSSGNLHETEKEDFVSIDMKPVAANNNTPAKTDKSDATNTKATKTTKTKDHVKISMDNITALNQEDPDEFDIGESMPSNVAQAKQLQQQKAQKTNGSGQKSSNPGLVSEGSMYKYVKTRPPSALSTKVTPTVTNSTTSKAPKKAVAPLTRQPSRPLTAGGSRPITAGAKRGTSDKDYKTQGKSVRSEVIKKLVP